MKSRHLRPLGTVVATAEYRRAAFNGDQERGSEGICSGRHRDWHDSDFDQLRATRSTLGTDGFNRLCAVLRQPSRAFDGAKTCHAITASSVPKTSVHPADRDISRKWGPCLWR